LASVHPFCENSPWPAEDAMSATNGSRASVSSVATDVCEPARPREAREPLRDLLGLAAVGWVQDSEQGRVDGGDERGVCVLRVAGGGAARGGELGRERGLPALEQPQVVLAVEERAQVRLDHVQVERVRLGRPGCQR
jgi:hypothetical protein